MGGRAVTQPPRGQVPGSATNDAAVAGNIGELISASIASGGAVVAMSTGTPVTITSVALTPGDWDVWVAAQFTGNALTTVTYLMASISQVANTLDTTTADKISTLYTAAGTLFATLTGGTGPTVRAGMTRVSVAALTNLYLVAQAGFAINSLSGFGVIQARRAR